MIRYFLLFINLIGITLYRLFTVSDVSVAADIPSITSAGSEFVVQLTISKGSVDGFAKLQQDLPKGFTAIEMESKGASFTFSNQAVKFIWTSLPADAEIKISYKVKVDADVTGTKTISGKFSYLAENVKKTVDVPSSTITITDEEVAQAKTEPNQVVSTPTPSQTTTTPTPENTNNITSKSAESVTSTPINNTPSSATMPVMNITANRKIPTEAGGEFVVELTINKGALAGFAKLQENLPEGLTASVIDAGGASFTFAEQQAKFVWISLPSSEELKVSYKVVAQKGLIAQKNIDGVFSYLENDETKKYMIASSGIFVNNTFSGTEKTSTEPTSTAKTNTAAEEIPATSVAPAQNGVKYRVQICAIHRNVSTSYFSNKYGISESIYTETHDGWVKYTVGGFNEYKQARDHRESTRSKGIEGPFVTAYNSGKRITMQEALMITNQQWYK